MTDPTIASTPFLDFDNPQVAEFAHRSAGTGSDRERAVRLYYAVRDGIRYDPYAFRVSPDWLRASRTLLAGFGWCVPKSILLASCCRAEGIPARLGFADVRNHLATDRLLRLMDTPDFLWHGYVGIYLDGRWVKATPSFNVEMCRRFGVKTLEFDGTQDSLLQPYDERNRLHMEYLRDRGLYNDLPYEEAARDWRTGYARLIEAAETGEFSGRFDTDRMAR